MENMKVQQKSRTEAEMDQLVQYILLELPVYINGAQYDGEVYSLQPYHGLGKID